LDFLQAQVFSEHPLAFLTQTSAPWDAPGCFNPFWWFRLEDQTGNPISVPVKEAELDDLLSLLPEPIEPENNISAPVVLDRVIVDACNYDNHWGRPKCFVANNHASSACHNDAIANAILTGLATALGTWVLSGAAFFLIHGRSKVKGAYEQLVDERSASSPCPPVTLFMVSLVAVGGAALCSWGSMQLVNEMLRSQLCYDFDETLVIIVTAGLSCAMAIILILQYMSRAHPGHSHPLITQPVPVVKPESKLVLVEVHADGKTAIPVPTSSEPHPMGSGSMQSLQLQGQPAPTASAMSTQNNSSFTSAFATQTGR
jgi:hypothetical protein